MAAPDVSTEWGRMIQYWKNGVMMSKVTPDEAREILHHAKRANFQVYDNTHDGYFEIITGVA